MRRRPHRAQPSRPTSSAWPPRPDLASPTRAVGVDRELLLVPLELRPVDITFVVILEHDLPLLERLAVSVGLLRTPIDDLSAILALSVDVGPGIEGILEDRDDVAVADRRPVEGDQRLPSDGRGK